MKNQLAIRLASAEARYADTKYFVTLDRAEYEPITYFFDDYSTALEAYSKKCMSEAEFRSMCDGTSIVTLWDKQDFNNNVPRNVRSMTLGALEYNIKGKLTTEAYKRRKIKQA